MLKDLTGQRFGMLTVLGRSKLNMYGGKATGWDCKCDCGKEKQFSTAGIHQAKSCGCMTKQLRQMGSVFLVRKGSTWTDIKKKRMQLEREFAQNNLPAAQALGIV